MKRKNDAVWKAIIERLNTAYAVGGREALSKMTLTEVHVLYAEKTAELKEAKTRQGPDDGLGQLRMEKLQREVKDISGWLKENTADFREIKGKDRDSPMVRRMLDDVEAVTKAHYYADPELIASPIEMFRMPEGKSGGEPFAFLSGREKWQVLGDYTHWQEYERRGIGFAQLDRVFTNVIDGKPREQWLEGTGLSLPAERQPKTTLQQLRMEIEADQAAALAEPERLARTRAEKLLGPLEVPAKEKDLDLER